MAKRKTSIVDDLIDIAAKLPWWVGVLLALVSYLWLHSIATSSAVPITLQNNQFQSIGSNFGRTWALIGQYILPMIFLFGAATSAISTKRKRIMLDSQSSLESIKQLSWQAFEELVGEYYRRCGYTVTETEAGPDGGIDLILKKDGDTTVVQCKQWKKSKVGVAIIRELFGVMHSMGAQHGKVVSTGTFTQDAEAFAEQNGIELVGGHHLISLIGTVQKDKKLGSIKAASPEMVECPVCKSPMVMRLAKKGKNAGNQFWGCSQYPKCRGTRTYS